MGLGRSSESRPAACSPKVIMADGDLREFGGPVTAAQVLQRDPSCFLCDADGMDAGDRVTAVGAGEELRLGGLYFALPRAMLRRRLQPAEMAALAVRAGAAFRKGGASAAFGERTEGGEAAARRTAPACGFSAGSGGERRRTAKASGRNRKFTSELSAVPE